MTDSTLDVTQPFDRPQKLLKIIDNGDGTYSLASVMFNGLVTKSYDYISLGYTGDNLTSVVYKTGGASGTTVATLTLVYSGSTLTSVTKT
jgi:hypothetical protein